MATYKRFRDKEDKNYIKRKFKIEIAYDPTGTRDWCIGSKTIRSIILDDYPFLKNIKVKEYD